MRTRPTEPSTQGPRVSRARPWTGPSALVWLALAAGWAPGTARAAPSPSGLTVCPAAQQAERDGKKQPVYVAGRDDWLFRRDQELLVSYPPTDHLNPVLVRLREELARRGTTLVIARLPPRGVVHADKVDPEAPGAEGFDAARARADFEAHVAWLSRHGILVPDILGAMEADAPVAGDAYRARDHHWRPEGAHRSTRAIATTIQAHAGDTPLPVATFERRELPAEAHRGALLRRVEALCGPQAVPDETIPITTTVAVGGGLDAAALFGDAPVPEVVLVGDSNTNKGGRDAFNVAGSLREALGTDVLNAAVDGAGLYPPLLAWLQSPEFQDHPPRYLVWVSGAHLPLHNRSQLQQAIATVSGPCGTDRLAHQTVSVTEKPGPTGTIPVLVPSPPLVADRLRLQISAAAPRAFGLVLHQGGKTQQVAVRRSDRVGVEQPTLVEVFVEKGALERVELKPWTDGTGSIDVVACGVPSP